MPKLFWTVSLILICSFPLILLSLGALDAQAPSSSQREPTEIGQARIIADLVKTASAKLGELEQTEVNLLFVQGETLKLREKHRKMVEELQAIDHQLSRFQTDRP